MPATPRTPYLRVDLDVLRRNVRRVADWSRAHQVALRPHAKTHKTPQIADLQLAAGAVGLTVATIGEAEVFARHGVRDLLIAYPLWVDDVAAARLRELARQVALTLVVESTEGAAALGRHLGGVDLAVLVEVDSGQHRTGCAPHDAGRIAAVAARTGLDVRGVMTFPGHSYAPGVGASTAHDEAVALTMGDASLRAVGLEPTVRSGGSTPSLAGARMDVVTELRPGVYVFGDAQQWELGTCAPEDIALACRATVVSHAGGRLVLDAGSKALGADRAAYSSGWGRLPAHPAARVVSLSEHHALVQLRGEPLPGIGSQVDVVPNHVCAAVNLAAELWVSDRAGTDRWVVAARGRNS